MPSLDFGAAQDTRLVPELALSGLVMAALLGLTALASIPSILADRKAAIADAVEWTIQGPPCPRLSPGQYDAQPYKAWRTFGYADYQFGRFVGHASCAELRYDGGRRLIGPGYPVCQFTSAAVISVETGGRTVYFAPGLGKRATVAAPHGRVACVMAGKFRG